MPGLPFIANDIAPRPPGGADAAVPDFHHPDAEQIRPSLHAVVPGAVAGGISGFEDDAEVEHRVGKENVPFLSFSASSPTDRSTGAGGPPPLSNAAQAAVGRAGGLDLAGVGQLGPVPGGSDWICYPVRTRERPWRAPGRPPGVGRSGGPPGQWRAPGGSRAVVAAGRVAGGVERPWAGGGGGPRRRIWRGRRGPGRTGWGWGRGSISASAVRPQRWSGGPVGTLVELSPGLQGLPAGSTVLAPLIREPLDRLNRRSSRRRRSPMAPRPWRR